VDGYICSESTPVSPAQPKPAQEFINIEDRITVLKEKIYTLSGEESKELDLLYILNCAKAITDFVRALHENLTS
jgi:hypothetical protein